MEKGGTLRTILRHPGTGATGSWGSSRMLWPWGAPAPRTWPWRHKLFTDPGMKMLLALRKRLCSRTGHVQVPHQDPGAVLTGTHVTRGGRTDPATHPAPEILTLRDRKHLLPTSSQALCWASHPAWGGSVGKGTEPFSCFCHRDAQDRGISASRNITGFWLTFKLGF